MVEKAEGGRKGSGQYLHSLARACFVSSMVAWTQGTSDPLPHDLAQSTSHAVFCCTHGTSHPLSRTPHPISCTLTCSCLPRAKLGYGRHSLEVTRLQSARPLALWTDTVHLTPPLLLLPLHCPPAQLHTPPIQLHTHLPLPASCQAL